MHIHYFLFVLGAMMFSQFSYAQQYVWYEDNVGSSPGERVVATIDAGTISQYAGVGLVGEVIDANGNWGYKVPSVAKFEAYVSFSDGLTYGITQNIQLTNITLRLRKISDTKVCLTALCGVSNTAMQVRFDKVVGKVSVTLGDSNTVNAAGELLVSAPSYTKTLSGTTTLSGQFNIGNNNSAGGLAVNGNIRAKEVKVETANWPDYVFEENYRLPSLMDLESYIKSNKHLPNIPDQKQVEAEGISLGEMNQKLLEKVEELTLMLIEKDKENRAITTKLEGQEAEIQLIKQQLSKLKL